jgi:hypothetical protein
VSKGQLYKHEQSYSIPGFACVSVVPSCIDANDLPLTAYWNQQGHDRRLITESLDHWTDTESPASTSFTICNDAAVNQPFYAYIVCISVE